ncbi:protein of unknown function [Micropruina glycogenica]|uniref:Uncharacterized protein n=1 Tax=Micropruina glycogenica TaxID=75385 RepID=A0A2N9JI92_9ACTN|nr:protein of unknown function [Micropruina glycogenica]
MSVARSLRRLLHPQDHGTLEDITLHPQLCDLGPEPFQLLVIIGGELTVTLPTRYTGVPGRGALLGSAASALAEGGG